MSIHCSFSGPDNMDGERGTDLGCGSGMGALPCAPVTTSFKANLIQNSVHEAIFLEILFGKSTKPVRCGLKIAHAMKITPALRVRRLGRKFESTGKGKHMLSL